jgi:hypothetical protein
LKVWLRHEDKDQEMICLLCACEKKYLRFQS